jgi:hypothetical protein
MVAWLRFSLCRPGIARRSVISARLLFAQDASKPDQVNDKTKDIDNIGV